MLPDEEQIIRILAESGEIHSLPMEVLQKTQCCPNCGFLIPFAYRREIGDAFPDIALFGVCLSNPVRFRIRVAVENLYAVASSVNCKLQRSVKLALRSDLLKVGEYLRHFHDLG